MRKTEELTNPNSCMSKARPDEMTFVLLGRDAAAPATIRFWISERIRLSKNQPNDPQIVEAYDCAKAMESDLRRPIKPRVRLEEWWCDSSQYGAGYAPFDFEYHTPQYLHGVAYGHPRFPDGTHVYTSRITSIDWEKREVETRNSTYVLGNAERGYASAMNAQMPEVYNL